MAHGDNQAASEHAFDVVLRGYDRRQVDDHIAGLEGRLAATGRECAELRMQRDAEASRARDLESRVRSGSAGPGAAAPPAPAAQPVAAQAPARPQETWSSFDGLGAKVEAIMRVAAEEAEGIRRSAVESGRKHAEAEDRLRSTFQSISERLQPLVSLLDEESTSARAAVDGATSDAGTLENAAQQQAKAMIDAAAATAARMRADAETRVEITARQVADVREELALVRQILTSLGPDSGGQPTSGQPNPPTGTAGQPGPPNGAAAPSPGQPAGPGDESTSRTGTVRVPSMSGAGSPQPSGPGSASEQTMPGGQPAAGGNGAAGADAVSMAKPAAQNPAAPPFRGPANDAPTETIALPLVDPAGAQQSGAGNPSGQHHQQS